MSIDSASAVARIGTPTQEEFVERYVDTGTPVVITGAMNDWPALAEWSLDSLRQRMGGKRITVNRRRNGLYDAVDPVKMDFGEYADILEDPERREAFYLNGRPTSSSLPELADDFRIPSFLESSWAEELHVWLGYDSRTVNHFHSTKEAVLCQIVGKKEVTLYPPSQTRALYPRRFFAYDHNCSRVDVHRPEHAAFPRFREAEGVTCTLEPGEMLFIPIHWWHAVRGLDLSFSGTFFWNASLKNWHFPTPGIRCGVHLLLSRAPFLRRAIPAAWK